MGWDTFRQSYILILETLRVLRWLGYTGHSPVNRNTWGLRRLEVAPSGIAIRAMDRTYEGLWHICGASTPNTAVFGAVAL